MSLKEEFMKIITYEKWDKRRYEFKGLDAGDMEVREWRYFRKINLVYKMDLDC